MNLPVTPVIPPTVVQGQPITAEQMNAVIQAIADLWTNQQALAAQVAAVGGLALR
jgi:hypothetical protein